MALDDIQLLMSFIKHDEATQAYYLSMVDLVGSQFRFGEARRESESNL